jgi:hypothetical protein
LIGDPGHPGGVIAAGDQHEPAHAVALLQALQAAQALPSVAPWSAGQDAGARHTLIQQIAGHDANLIADALAPSAHHQQWGALLAPQTDGMVEPSL